MQTRSYFQALNETAQRDQFFCEVFSKSLQNQETCFVVLKEIT